MRWNSQLLVAAGTLLGSCLAWGDPVRHDATWEPEYVLVATAQNTTINCQSRYSVLFNGTAPGPALNLQEGKTTWVRVYNNIQEQNVTVHWHGLTQRTAPFADGTPLISQWPIAPGEYFDYEIHPEAGDAGTYMYHSHVGMQATTAHGLVIVDDAEGTELPYHYDDDLAVVFSDFYPAEDEEMEKGLRAKPFVWNGEPEAVLFNHHSGNASFTNATDDSCKPYIFNVEPGKTYRLRFASVTALSFVMAAIEDHTDLTIVEADGHWTKPAETDYVQLGSGQRYSVLLKTKTEEELKGKTNYWIRYETRERPTQVTGYALLQYNLESSYPVLPPNLPQQPPMQLPTDRNQFNTWMEYTLSELPNPNEKYPSDEESFPPLSSVTRTVTIRLNQVVTGGPYQDGTVMGHLRWTANNLTWAEAPLQKIPTTEPYLVTAYKTGETPDYDAAIHNGGWDPETKAFPAKVGEVLDIVWESNSGPTGGWDQHPMHAHGQHFWDLGSGNGTYDAEENEKKFFENGKYIPARRDSTMLFRYAEKGLPHTTAGWRAWRLRVTEDNVGAWMMHCHVLAHMTMGMQTVWVFGDGEDLREEIPQPYVEGYLEYGGSAYGNASYDPLVMGYFD